jgi:DNA repair exonuclease SbcCD ATPase subunit
MKTLSLRIRGAKVELEDAGEDVDGMANSVSELQKKLLALTGGKVDIMLDENTFKNTTEILREMSQVWDDMTDVNRAAALELLGGKRQANVLSAVIKNFDLVEDAMQTSADSAGSAMAENEKYLDSIQGKIDQFTNAVQTMWMNFIRSDVVKFLVDVGTGLVNIIDKVGVLQSALITIAGIQLGKFFLPDLWSKLTNAIKSNIATYAGETAAIEALNGAKVKEAILNSTKIGDATKEAAIRTILTGKAGEETVATNLNTAAKIREALATQGIVGADAEAIIAAMGLTTANTGLIVSFKALAASIWEAVAAAAVWLVTNPVGWAILAVAAIAALTVTICALTKSHKDYVEELKDTSEELDNIRSNIESLNSELETTKSRIEELESKGPLTLTEQEELDKLKEQNAELERQIRLEEAREERAKNKQAEAVKGALDTDQDFKTRPTGTLNLKDTNNFEDELGKVKNAKDKLDKAEAEVQDALDSGMDTNSKKFQKLEKNLESAQEDYADAQSNWDEFMKGKEEEYGVSDLEWFDGDNLTEAQKAVNGLLSSMQNYNDRAEIMFGSAGAKESALDRLFGERGSEAGQAFQEAFNAKIESGEINVDVDKFGDYESAIEGVTGEVESLIAENPQLKVQLDSLGISAEDVARYFLNISGAMQQTSEATSVAVSDIASLTSAYDSYASVLQTVNDITFDGQAISDDYYTALQEYLGDVTVGEESFGDAIDTTNGKVVKNTRLLRALIAQKKKEQKATVSAAKAQSQSQYTKVVKQLQQAVKAMYADYKAYGYVTKATYDNISALRSQIQALKNAVKEYSILELKLSDVTNAYDEFEDAKNRDSEVAYGDSMVEMLETISDGLLSGKVGTEAFKAACEALVPPSVIANCKTFEERLDAIDDYFENSKFADYFTIDEDGNFSIGLKNIEAFIADAKEASAFIENADGTFTLDNSIKSVDDLANAMGLTKAATIAMLTELSKYDASWGDIVSDLTMTELDKKLRDTTDSLDKALAKQEEFFKAGKDPLGENAEEYNAIQQEIDGATDSLNNAQQAIVDNTKAWIDANNTVDTAKENVSTLTRELQELKDAGASDEKIQIKTDELEKAKEQLAEALKIKYGLEQPTVMDFQVVLTDVQSKIDQWKEENATLVTEVVPKLEQDKDGVWKIPATLELDEDQQQKIQEYVDLKNDEQQLEVLTNQEVDPITDGITQVKEVLDNILDAIQSPDKNKKQDTKTTDTTKTSSGTTSTSTEQSASATSTSNVTGFEAQSPDQVIAGWNALVDEISEEVSQFANNIWSGVSTFFTETLPTVWDNLWNSIGDKLSGAEEWAQGLWEDINTFFTDTLPQKWDEFWSGVGECLDGVKGWAANVEEGVNTFFTETIPEKWNEFWGSVGEFLGDIPYAVGYISAKVEEFFTETVPEKWGEFWDNVSEDFDKVKQWASDLKDAVVTFFTETIPEKWDEFWDGVGEELNNLKEDAIALKDKVVEFFTTTIPTKWSEFWTSVGEYIDGTIAPALSAAWDSVYGFFTETVPEKWHSFWESVGTYVDEVIGPALVTAGEKILEFFTATLPTKWNEFWEGVGTFLTETVPTTLENIKTGISTFFTETVPSAINGLWESAASWISTQASNFWNNLKSKFTQGREDAKSGSGYNPDGASSALGNALAKGNAHSGKKPGLKANEHNAIVGELGRELVVDANKGVYYTVGEHGTEMLDLPKGAIIYNHKQTEELLKNGYTSRGTYTGGLSFAKGNAHWNYGTYTKKTGTGANAAWGDGSDKDWSQMGWDLSDAASDLSDAASDVSDAADDSEQTIDFIEYKLEEIEKAITHMTNRIENFLDDTSQIGDKNSLYDDLVGAEKQKASTYFAAAELYNQKATELLSKVPAEYQEMAKNGAIAIKDFIGESEGEIADAIEEYRTWSTKAEDAENSYLESIAEISAKRLEQLNDIADDFENIVGLVAQHSSLIQAEMDLLDEAGERLSENFYKELMKDSQKQIEDLNNKRASLQSILDQAVASGDVRVGTDDWYEMVNAIYDVDDSILSCKKDIEGFQNSINDLYWDNLDKLIDKIDNVDSELSHLYNLVSDEEKVVDEFGNWTKDGVTALGLLAQQLEAANFKVEQYGEAIARLEKDYAAGLYSTDEYNEKLAELKENQWDAIEAQEAAKKSIIDLNKTRVQAVKDGLQKEIDSFSELIDKKKEELSLQKEANDFSKQVAEQQKNIADIQKRLAVISGDNSASAIAQKKKLQAELKQAQDELNDLYYDHSVEKQQEALDKSLENYQDNKQDEMDALDESLKNENQVIQDSYAVIAANTDSLAQNLSEIADKYGITLSDSVTKPWLEGVDAIGTYQEQLDTSASAFTEQLRALKQELVDLQVEADKTADSIIKATNNKKNSTESAKYTPPTPSTPQQSPATEPSTPAAPTKGSSVTVKKSATNFSRNGGNGTRMQSWVPGSTFTVYQATDSEVLIGRNGGYTGWVRLSDIEGYSSGAKSIDKDQFAFLDELGEELQLVPDGAGRLSYIKKGTGIIPADLTERLMEWGKLDPSSVLEQSRPVVSAPHVINNNLELNLQVGEVVHIDRADNSSIPNITKAVQDQMDNYMKNINKKLYNRVR